MNEERCEKCAGSGEIAIDARSCRYIGPGPVPDDAKNIARSTCFYCLGTGFAQLTAPLLRKPHERSDFDGMATDSNSTNSH